jgi:hypothetical protein
VKLFVFPLVEVMKRYHKNADILTDILWALSYLSDFDGDQDMINYVMSTGVAHSLVNILNDPSIKINRLPLVRIIGNFIVGISNQAQIVIGTPGFMKGIKNLLNCGSKSIRSEACWVVSNVAAGSRDQISLLMKNTTILHQVIQFALEDHWEVRSNALWAIINICTSESRSCHISALVRSGGLEPLIEVLPLSNASENLICGTLDALKSICETSSDFVKMVYDEGGTKKIEDLQEHSSHKVYSKSVNIIETFYSGEEEEDENVLPEVDDSGNFSFRVPSPKQLFKDTPPQRKFNFGGFSTKNNFQK